MIFRRLYFYIRNRVSRFWLLLSAAMVLAVAVSVVVFKIVPAAPMPPAAIPVPVPLPLKHITVPEPPDLMVEYVKDRQAAIALGKALFWDMQVGSDGQMACASCHFHAGGDGRTQNTINPGPDGVFNVAFLNEAVTTNVFPFHERADPDFQNSTITRDLDDMVGSQGVRSRTFVDIVPGQAAEITTAGEENVFIIDETPIRRVTSRNAPTVINAVFFFDNFWDGRASNIFNGVNPNGATDPNAKVFVATVDGLQSQFVIIRNASLASQAVGPPMDGSEMSAAGRTFPKVGKKMLSLDPLALQRVHPTDSVLGPMVPQTGPGLTTTYAEMIQSAFHDKWWSNVDQIVTYQNGVPTISPHPGTPLTTDQFTHMEANFALFFGLAIQLYEATLVSDDSPFDQVMEGKRAFSPIEELGNELFIGSCAQCHAGSEFTTAAHSNVAFGQGVPLLVELMLNTDFEQVNYDDGFFNIGVTRTSDDIARGALDPFGRPLSHSELGRMKELGQLPDHFAPYVWDLPANANRDKKPVVNGAFKAPTLRNIELTGPYFHNGGVKSLSELMDFYTRGGNFPIENRVDLDPDMIELPDFQNHPELKAAVIAFLHTLTDERVRYERAPFDHPQLFVPNAAVPGDLTTDTMLEIPAVGSSGRVTPLQSILLPPNLAPVATDDVFAVPYESTNVILNVLLNDGDLDGDPIEVGSVSSPSTNGATIVIGPEAQTVVYSAPNGFSGNDSFTYTVTDGAESTPATVNVTVQDQNTNRPPEANFDLFPIVQAEGVGVPVAVILNDQDLDGNPIFITSVTNVTNGSAEIDPVGDQILFTPNQGFYGLGATMSYTISDGVSSASAQVTLKVNSWPVANPDSFEVRTNSANNALMVLNNDIDYNLDDIITVLAFEPLYKGTAVIDPTGTFISYTPFPGATGIERFTYFMGDGIVADSATVEINIKANSTPLLVNDFFTVSTNVKNNILYVLDNDSDADGDTITITSVTGASHGVVSIMGGKTLQYTPDLNFYGTDTFYYVATDGQSSGVVAKVTIQVELPNKIFLPMLNK